ncbi:DUF533 domain-containing protein [Sedimentitalea arenosa]|uniref:DUF533 domain-containing protein n=1 Tax=Sedimentitalea arenosa TaxID=2798803 RepID=A0A8J7LSU1_9RHOB|nr:DUF533 domain-containing protein [Arenibacterium arenosum]MBJ6373213.1 DUF533 domain-containing protein [Arenibacterium arenosum]
MALVGTLAKVAVGYARSRDLLKDNDDPIVDAGHAREVVESAREKREKVGAVVTDLKEGRGKDRAREAMKKRLKARMDGSPLPETGGETATESVSDAEADLGADAMLTALSGAASESGRSIDELLDAYNDGGEVAEVEQSARLLLRAILMAAKADGEIDAAERAVIVESLGPAPEPEHLALLQELLAAPVDVTALAAATPPRQIVQVYTSSLMAIRLDTPPEAVFLHRLAEALRLDEHVVNALHAQMGRPLLYRQE